MCKALAYNPDKFMARTLGREAPLFLVAVDIGKSARCIGADYYGEMVVVPFEVALTGTGFALLEAAIVRARAAHSWR